MACDRDKLSRTPQGACGTGLRAGHAVATLTVVTAKMTRNPGLGGEIRVQPQHLAVFPMPESG
jgi:hypothetical protein